MSQENVDLVRRLNDVFNERSFVENADLLDPDMVWDMSRVGLPDAASVTGRFGLLDFLDTWTESFASEYIDAEEIVNSGDQVMVMVRHSVRGRTSGIDIDQRFAMVWTLRDGRATRMDMYLTRDDALEAMGLREQAMSQENVEVVRSAIAAWNAGDMDAVRALLDPGIVLRPPEGWPEPERIPTGSVATSARGTGRSQRSRSRLRAP